MPIRFKAIKPRQPLLVTSKLERQLTSELNGFVSDVEDRMSTYPPQPAWTHYRRTGTLMRSWSFVRARRIGGALVAKAGSNANVAPYNEQVQGARQQPLFARIGWRKVWDVANQLWPARRARIIAIIESAGGRRSSR